MLKRVHRPAELNPIWWQPPSGGCVLKHLSRYVKRTVCYAAAFGRLCVETIVRHSVMYSYHAAAFGRLCVETHTPVEAKETGRQPPSGGCVLKPTVHHKMAGERMAAAFGRLCVETQAW